MESREQDETVTSGRRAFLLGGGNMGKYLAPALLAVVSAKASASP